MDGAELVIVGSSSFSTDAFRLVEEGQSAEKQGPRLATGPEKRVEDR
jgi:hypothetical protein